MENENQTMPQFWNYEDVDADTARLRFYGEVRSARPTDWWTGEPDAGDYITPEGFKEDMEKCKDKKVLEININSPGGDVYTGLAIHNVLRSISAKKIITIDGLAASAASIIAMAGNVVKMHPGSLMMIHNVMSGLCGYYTSAELKKVIKSIDADERASAAIYSEKTGLDELTVRGLMDKETWLTGKEAVEKGFADELAKSGNVNIAIDNKNMIVINGLNCGDLGRLHLPEKVIKDLPKLDPEPEKTEPEKNIQNKNKEVKKMDIKELKEKHPELVAQIEAEASAAAVAAEHARLAEIEALAPVLGNQELVEAAKFGEKPMTAAELTLAVAKAAATTGAAFLEARAQETAPAAELEGATAPTADDPATIAAKEAAETANSIDKVVNLVKKL